MRAAPVLVLAPPGPNPARLAAMLGCHPQAQHLPELTAFMAPTIEGLLELYALTDGSPGHGLKRAIAAVYCGGQTDEAIARAEHWLRRRADWTGALLIDALAASLAPRLLVSADTSVGWRPDQLDLLLDQSPDLRIVHLIEHPRPWGRERVRDLRGRLFIAPDFKDYAANPPVIEPQLAWHRVHTNIDRAFELLPASQYQRLRVEDLYAAPEATLTQLCQWLGLSFDAEAIEAMQHPERSVFASFGPETAVHGADEAFHAAPYFLRRLPARESLVGALEWREGSVPFAAETRSLAGEYGYA